MKKLVLRQTLILLQILERRPTSSQQLGLPDKSIQIAQSIDIFILLCLTIDMQKIRPVGQALQLREELDIITFSPQITGVSISRKQSKIEHTDRKHHIRVEGRDNIRDLAQWLSNLVDPTEGIEHPTTASFTDYTIDRHTAAACIAISPPEDMKSSSLGFYVHKPEILPSRPGKELNGDPIDKGHNLDLEAFAYPFGYPADQQPVLLAKLAYDEMLLSRDGGYMRHTEVPTAQAIQLGQWMINGLQTVQPKSIWG